MKTFVLLAIVLAAVGVHSSQEESGDELGLSQRRAKLVACMVLTRARIVDDQVSTEEVIKRSKHDPKKTRDKIVAELIYNCFNAITFEQADSLFSEESIDLSRPDYAKLSEVNEAIFADPSANIDVRPDQLALIQEIQTIITEKEERFSQDPPKPKDLEAPRSSVSQLQLSDWLQYAGTAVGALMILSVGWLIVKKLGDKPKSKKEAKLKKKTR